MRRRRPKKRRIASVRPGQQGRRFGQEFA